MPLPQFCRIIDRSLQHVDALVPLSAREEEVGKDKLRAEGAAATIVRRVVLVDEPVSLLEARGADREDRLLRPKGMLEDRLTSLGQSRLGLGLRLTSYVMVPSFAAAPSAP